MDEKTKRETIIITEIPDQLNKSRLIERIAELVKEKKIEGISELFQLTEEDLLNFHDESNYFLEAMSNAYNADKMNIASLGNIVSQLHTHVIVRYKNDEAWPSPVWSFQKKQKYQSDAAKIEIDKLTDLVDHYI